MIIHFCLDKYFKDYKNEDFILLNDHYLFKKNLNVILEKMNLNIENMKDKEEEVFLEYLKYWIEYICPDLFFSQNNKNLLKAAKKIIKNNTVIQKQNNLIIKHYNETQNKFFNKKLALYNLIQKNYNLFYLNNCIKNYFSEFLVYNKIENTNNLKYIFTLNFHNSLRFIKYNKTAYFNMINNGINKIVIYNNNILENYEYKYYFINKKYFKIANLYFFNINEIINQMTYNKIAVENCDFFLTIEQNLLYMKDILQNIEHLYNEKNTFFILEGLNDYINEIFLILEKKIYILNDLKSYYKNLLYKSFYIILSKCHKVSLESHKELIEIVEILLYKDMPVITENSYHNNILDKLLSLFNTAPVLSDKILNHLFSKIIFYSLIIIYINVYGSGFLRKYNKIKNIFFYNF
jgi:hypothetical protein